MSLLQRVHAPYRPNDHHLRSMLVGAGQFVLAIIAAALLLAVTTLP